MNETNTVGCSDWLGRQW